MPSKKFLNHSFDVEFKDLYDIDGLEKIHKKIKLLTMDRFTIEIKILPLA